MKKYSFSWSEGGMGNPWGDSPIIKNESSLRKIFKNWLGDSVFFHEPSVGADFGFPDMTVVKDGKCGFVELKRATSSDWTPNLRPSQWETNRKLVKSGATVSVVVGVIGTRMVGVIGFEELDQLVRDEGRGVGVLGRVTIDRLVK